MKHQNYRGCFGTASAWVGTVIIVIGIVLLLHNLNLFHLRELWNRYWPALLILLGLWLILKRMLTPSQNFPGIDQWTVDDQRQQVQYQRLFGDLVIRLDSKDFQGGRVQTIFGDTEIDLRGLAISAGEKKLQVNGVFGDIEILAPEQVPFRVQSSLVAGEIEILNEKRSGFSLQHTYQSPDYDNARDRLDITISHVFGDIKIR
jgi:lia operon protein LiaF